MNNSKVAIATKSITGKIYTVLGYFLGISFLLGLILTITNSPSMKNTNPKSTNIIIYLILLPLAAFLILKGFRIKQQIKRFRTYVGLISLQHITSLEGIANNTSQSIDFVRSDIQTMIEKKYFANAYIDRNTNEIVIGGSIQVQQESAESSGVLQQNVAANNGNSTTTATVNTIVENESITCPGCGAINLKKKGAVAHCEYCGSLIN